MCARGLQDELLGLGVYDGKVVFEPEVSSDPNSKPTTSAPLRQETPERYLQRSDTVVPGLLAVNAAVDGAIRLGIRPAPKPGIVAVLFDSERCLS
jgi:hypothetical protein